MMKLRKTKADPTCLLQSKILQLPMIKKIVTLKEFTKFQKVLLKEMGLFEDEGVKGKTLPYSLALHFWTYIKSEITLSAAGNIYTKVCLQLHDDAIDFFLLRLLLLKRTTNFIRYLTLHL